MAAGMRLKVEGTRFRDGSGREVTLRGINCAADSKFPSSPHLPSHISDQFFNGDNVSFVDRPFPLDEAHIHFARLRRYGYNSIRYVFTWEALEHEGPGKYDEEFIKYTIEVLRKAKSYGFYVWMDPHQDVWSRFSGGSGAPLWTLYAMGLDPKHFAATEAALVHNVQADPATFPKMIWSTNYTRMACQAIFTMFFGGKVFTPKAIIDGKNIQDYLQDHLIAACKHLALRIHEAGDLERDVVIGWESLNEPNRGLISVQDISVIPTDQKLQKGTSPTAWQAILTGSGHAVEIDTWDFGGLGPYKTGSKLVDPNGTSAWLSPGYDDSRYGWKRDPEWKLGECIWAQHGVWDSANEELLRKDYFAKDPRNGKIIDYEYFTNTFFLDFYRKHSTAIKEVFPDAIMLCQPPVLEIPPSIKGTIDDDSNMVYAPHFYDGVTLMTKKWNRYWNVDVFGILRGKYLTPAFAIKLGETAIRNCIRDQLSAIRQEGLDYMGNHPCVFTEIGIPYDMDDKYAYKTGDYDSQIRAMDANHFALEGSGVAGYGLWVYVARNCHKWGDQWNGEDLSIFSLDDKPLPARSAARAGKSASLSNATLVNQDDPSSPSFSRSHSSEDVDVSPANLRRSTTTPSMTSDAGISNGIPTAQAGGQVDTRVAGYRAVEAVVRPASVFTAGNIKAHGFDLQNARFELSLIARTKAETDNPTEIFLPELHFPLNQTQVEVSSGKWEIYYHHGSDDESTAEGGVDAKSGRSSAKQGRENQQHVQDDVQRLRWWHGSGEQQIKINGVVRQLRSTGSARTGGGGGSGGDNEDGYLEQCQQQKCSVM